MSDIKEREFLQKCNERLAVYKKYIYGNLSNEYVAGPSDAFYNALKKLMAEYYKGEVLPFNYNFIIKEIDVSERLWLANDYTVDIPKHDFIKVIDAPTSLLNHAAVLDYIVDRTRRELYYKVSLGSHNFGFYESYSLQGFCGDASNTICRLARNFGLFCKKVKLHPAFNFAMGEKYGGNHTFAIVKIEGKTYLVDCTYSQFFLKKYCNFNRIGIPYFYGCAPGAFAEYDNTRSNLARILLNKGWIEVDDEVMKAYFDGFMLSYRNGLYYERTNDFSFRLNYTVKDYENFIYGIDSLLLHERKEELICQNRVLNNSHMLMRYKSE